MRRSLDRFAVVGATGAVGRELLGLLAARGHAPDRVCALASARSSGSELPFGEASVPVHELGAPALDACGLVFLAATRELARELAPRLVESGALVVDNSSDAVAGTITQFYSYSVIPEPGTGLLVTTGLMGLGVAGRRKRD